jgi:hypothetical protein
MLFPNLGDDGRESAAYAQGGHGNWLGPSGTILEAKMDVLSKKELETHITVVGWMQILNGLLGILVGAFLATLILGVGAAIEDPIVLRIMAVTASALGGLLFVLSIPGVIAGIGLLRRASWSRVMALVLAVFELVLFPTGTLLGGYTIFVLVQRAVPEVFGACCELEMTQMKAAAA